MWCCDYHDQVVDHLWSLLIASLCDLLELLLGILVGILLSCLVAALLLYGSVYSRAIPNVDAYLSFVLLEFFLLPLAILFYLLLCLSFCILHSFCPV